MPYCRCPTCGALFHLHVTGDLEDWHREHAPRHKLGELVETLPCLECWKKANHGGPPPSAAD